MAGTVSVRSDSDYIRVYVNDSLHIHFLRKHYRGMSSYHENVYTIDLLLKDQIITLEYDQRTLWLEVISNLDEVL